MRSWRLASAFCALLAGASAAQAEQMQRFGEWEVHYAVLPTGFLAPKIASHYGIVRGRGRALMNISVLDADNHSTRVAIHGHSIDLLGQQRPLAFREVAEGEAVYYLAEFKHTDEETLRFRVFITVPGRTSEMLLSFQQKLYWEEP